jgi:hypothetical protein
MLKKDFEVIVIFLYGLSSTLRLTKRKEKKRKERQEEEVEEVIAQLYKLVILN